MPTMTNTNRNLSLSELPDDDSWIWKDDMITWPGESLLTDEEMIAMWADTIRDELSEE